ncbi:TetR/AcrR family transcriptional regulator [Streptomyces sp. UC4497]
MSPAKSRGPYAKTAARRAEIVQAARESFAERGYAHASLRDIATRAGITAAGILHHFRDKDELLAAVLAQRDHQEWTNATAEVQEPADLARHFSKSLLRHQQDPELMRLWLELAAAASRPGHPAHSYFVGRQTAALTRLVEGLHKHSGSGRLRDGITPESAALQIEALLSGLQAKWLLRQDLDIIGPLNDFLRTLFVRDDERPGEE